jgi:hypothetical protein
MAREHKLGALPAVHPRLLLDHEVPQLLPVRPVQLRQRRLAPPASHHWLADKRAEPEEEKRNTLRAIETIKKPMFRIQIRIHMFLGLPDPDPLVRGMDPDLDSNPSIIKQN